MKVVDSNIRKSTACEDMKICKRTSEDDAVPAGKKVE
jgi:hypothetical protein